MERESNQEMREKERDQAYDSTAKALLADIPF